MHQSQPSHDDRTSLCSSFPYQPSQRDSSTANEISDFNSSGKQTVPSVDAQRELFATAVVDKLLASQLTQPHHGQTVNIAHQPVLQG
eukprot:IDg2761t1